MHDLPLEADVADEAAPRPRRPRPVTVLRRVVHDHLAAPRRVLSEEASEETRDHVGEPELAVDHDRIVLLPLHRQLLHCVRVGKQTHVAHLRRPHCLIDWGWRGRRGANLRVEGILAEVHVADDGEGDPHLVVHRPVREDPQQEVRRRHVEELGLLRVGKVQVRMPPDRELVGLGARFKW